MKNLHPMPVYLCQVLLTSVVLYLASSATASPLTSQSVPTSLHESKAAAAPKESLKATPVEQQAAVFKPSAESGMAPVKLAESPQSEPELKVAPATTSVQLAESVPAVEQKAALSVAKSSGVPLVASATTLIQSSAPVVEASPVTSTEPRSVAPAQSSVRALKINDDQPQIVPEIRAMKDEGTEARNLPLGQQVRANNHYERLSSEKTGAGAIYSFMKYDPSADLVVTDAKPTDSLIVHETHSITPMVAVAAQPKPEQVESVAAVDAKASNLTRPEKEKSKGPLVMGGLGPLHLLATTLCSYQPDKPVADEHLNQLYGRRASVRKTLFEFMSLKFTNLEKLSSRLGYGLQVVPVASPADNKAPGVNPSHGWPVVGKCTAHDLKLMGEAAWCDCQEGDPTCVDHSKSTQSAAAENSMQRTGELSKMSTHDESLTKVSAVQAQAPNVQEAPVATSGRASAARSISQTNSFLPSPEESSVISKLLHVSDMKDSPTVESTFYNLNLTKQQLVTLEAHATSTLECRRNALRYTKGLFNHLAENQLELSESWPKLYALIQADDCARKRMIDIVNALSGFRTDTTSIRRDNLEFAFAMDDLRAKVLESEVNVPLTFDRHFIEVEQFLQQSVRLMLANVQPNRAKLTSMRYRSLMYGASQQISDDQCIDLHQRLLARSYPNDCNPTQFGQLPDVLRMTASSLELWSIEKELSLYTARAVDYPNLTGSGQQKVKEDVNECISNLVSS